MKAIDKKTKSELYLDYVNDWLTVEGMAEHYGITREKMLVILSEGKDEHEKQFAR